MSLESMERFQKSLHLEPKKKEPVEQEKLEKETTELTKALSLARKEHDFRIVAQLLHNTDNIAKKIKITNIAIQRYFLREIENADTLEALQKLHVEILNKIDFISNTREYNLLAQNIYDKHHALK